MLHKEAGRGLHIPTLCCVSFDRPITQWLPGARVCTWRAQAVASRPQVVDRLQAGTVLKAGYTTGVRGEPSTSQALKGNRQYDQSGRVARRKSHHTSYRIPNLLEM